MGAFFSLTIKRWFMASKIKRCPDTDLTFNHEPQPLQLILSVISPQMAMPLMKDGP